MSNRSQEPRLYLLYEDANGEPRVHWQYFGEPRVPGCSRDRNGDLRPPPCRWVVRATSAKEACYFVHQGEYAGSTGDLGILWDRSAIHLRPLPEENLTEYWTVLTCYSDAGREASPWFPRADAEEVKTILDERGCYGQCNDDHHLLQVATVTDQDDQESETDDDRPRRKMTGQEVQAQVKEPLQEA